METSNWKKVKITDLFEIKGGAALTKSNWGESIYNYIGASSVNNGVTGKCDKWNYENILSINYDGSVGFSFWHPYKLFLSDRCRALIPKFKPTNRICIFIATVITKSLTLKYNYGKKLNTKRLSKESIYLPYKNDEIDWEWIEDFMMGQNSQILKLTKIKDSKNQSIDTCSWKLFKITDIFETNVPKKSLGEYDCWEVTGQTTNNGRRKKSLLYNQENIFTVVSVGDSGVTFWHPYKFWLGNNVQGLSPKFIVTNNIGVFLSVVMTKHLTLRHHYGKTASMKRLSERSIFLPAKNNEPDWEYMENFMNNLIEK